MALLLRKSHAKCDEKLTLLFPGNGQPCGELNKSRFPSNQGSDRAAILLKCMAPGALSRKSSHRAANKEDQPATAALLHKMLASPPHNYNYQAVAHHFQFWIRLPARLSQRVSFSHKRLHTTTVARQSLPHPPRCCFFHFWVSSCLFADRRWHGTQTAPASRIMLWD